MSDVNKEIEEMAENLEKSQKTVEEILVDLGPEGIRKALPTLSEEEQKVLLDKLQEMKKAKAVSMDKDYDPKIRRGKLTETRIQEDEVDDDKDEKLVKEELKGVDHQGDSTPEGFEGQVIKSILSDITDLEDVDDEDLSELAKSFDNDLDQLSDYLTNDDEDMLEKAKTVSRNGIRYYADGKNAGKKVGSVRGDKASINSIARARAKGKISAKGAKAGIKESNVRALDSKEREKNIAGGAPIWMSDKSDSAIKEGAARKLATKKTLSDPSIKDKKDKTEQAAERSLNIYEKIRSSNKPSSKDIKENKEANSEYNSAKKELLDEYTPKYNATKKVLKEKRDNMSKSLEELDSNEELQNAFVEAALAKGFTMDEIQKACEKKGIKLNKIKQVAEKEAKEEVEEHKSEMHDKAEDLVEKSLEQEIFEDFSKTWESKDHLIKARTGGRNHHFSVNQYYDEILAKSKETPVEDLKKGHENDVQSLIERGEDRNWDEVIEARNLKETESKANISFKKSFSDSDMDALFEDSESLEKKKTESLEKSIDELILEDLQKSKWKRVTRNGEQYYANGPHSGKKVGSVRGKGSKTSIEESKISDEKKQLQFYEGVAQGKFQEERSERTLKHWEGAKEATEKVLAGIREDQRKASTASELSMLEHKEKQVLKDLEGIDKNLEDARKWKAEISNVKNQGKESSTTGGAEISKIKIPKEAKNVDRVSDRELHFDIGDTHFKIEHSNKGSWLNVVAAPKGSNTWESKTLFGAEEAAKFIKENTPKK